MCRVRVLRFLCNLTCHTAAAISGRDSCLFTATAAAAQDLTGVALVSSILRTYRFLLSGHTVVLSELVC
jgi:hypothetical protein